MTKQELLKYRADYNLCSLEIPLCVRVQLRRFGASVFVDDETHDKPFRVLFADGDRSGCFAEGADWDIDYWLRRAAYHDPPRQD